MKTIVIIENEVLELKSLVEVFEKWQKEINILTASEEKEAISILSQQQVDLVVFDLDLTNKTTQKDFARLTHTFPYVPCITLLNEISQSPEYALERGASYCLAKPLNERQLLLHARDLLEGEASGTVKGIPIHSFLQMLESEGKTCTLEVQKKDDTGFLYVKDGTLLDAETTKFKGEKAAQQLLSWQGTWLKLRHFNGQRKLQIKKPLISIIMEVYQMRSEQEELQRKGHYSLQHQLPLQHMSTRGKKIPVTLGSDIKLEFPDSEMLTESIMVGLLSDHFLIVTIPHSYPDLDQLVGSPKRTIIRYVHDGKVWMFKSQLLQCIEAPALLLIFEYPRVMHFHELRNAKRASIYIPSTFHLDGEKELYGTLIDLSSSGSLCQLKHKNKEELPQIEFNAAVLLRCLLPGIKEEQQISGRVRNVSTAGCETNIGVEFENLQPHLADTIAKYLYDLENASN